MKTGSQNFNIRHPSTEVKSVQISLKDIKNGQPSLKAIEKDQSFFKPIEIEQNNSILYIYYYVNL